MFCTLRPPRFTSLSRDPFRRGTGRPAGGKQSRRAGNVCSDRVCVLAPLHVEFDSAGQISFSPEEMLLPTTTRTLRTADCIMLAQEGKKDQKTILANCPALRSDGNIGCRVRVGKVCVCNRGPHSCLTTTSAHCWRLPRRRPQCCSPCVANDVNTVAWLMNFPPSEGAFPHAVLTA